MQMYPLMPMIMDSMLSPIQEETEEMLITLTPDIIYDNKQTNTSNLEDEQQNNNTLLEPEMTDQSTPNQTEDVRRSNSPDMMSDIPQRNMTAARPRPEIVRSMEPVRRPEAEVEVLKQKYINNDIRDLPCGELQGPILYGRLHRSRSQHLNLASQDIRSQMNKLRVKAGSNPNGVNARMQSRYSRSNTVCNKTKENLKTLEELLNGDLEVDDYDPELARLFDDYVEDCDQTKRVDFNSSTSLIKRTGKQSETSESQTADTETKEAFWRGFMEGMNHSKHQHPGESEANQAITEQDAPREAPQHPCIDKPSHTEMIRNNQDITHRSLKEWEKIQSCSTSLTSDVNDSNSECFACNTEQQKLPDLLSKKVESSGRPSSGGMKDKAENKITVQRDVFHLGQTNINLKLDKFNQDTSEAKNSSKGKSESKPYSRKGILKSSKKKKPEQCRLIGLEHIDPIDDKKRSNGAPVFDITNAVLPAISKHQPIEDSVNSDKSWSRHKDIDRGLCGTPVKLSEKRPKSKSNTIQEEPMSLTPGPFMVLEKVAFTDKENNLSRKGRTFRNNTDLKDDLSVERCQKKRNNAVEKQLSRIKNTLDDSVYKEYRFRDENINIITLAKMKLENKFMSNLGLEDMIKSRTDWVGEQSSLRCRSEPVAEKERKMVKNILRNLDLDGWEANTKPFNEQDTLHMSSSELLHPVDSFENFSSPTYWRQHNSTPIFLDKDILLLRSNEGTPVGSRTITPDRGTLTSAKLSDLEDGNASRRYYETTAFKPNNRRNKATERVTLRLTKSCDSFVANDGQYKDPAFDNIPLARCVSYNIQQKMKSGMTKAANINLSESLAKQLKELGKYKDILKVTTPRERCSVTNELSLEEYSEHDNNEVKRISSDLPLLDGKELTIQRSSLRQSPKSTIKDVILPVIDTCNPNMAMVSAVKSKHMVCDTSPIHTTLPSISGIPLLTPDDNQPMAQTIPDIQSAKFLPSDGETELWMTKSFPCRTKSLQTPYTFDKADSSKLMLRAKALPHLHSVCTSCGGINKRHENTSGHERTPSRGKTDEGKRKCVHHRCTKLANVGKWKLEESQVNICNDLSTIDISKVPDEDHLKLGPSKQPSKKTKGSTEYSTYKRTSNPADNEMTFKFLDQNIKLRFDLDIAKNEKVNIMESLQNATNTPEPLSSRMEDIVKPHHREMLECPIKRETRIYKEKNRQKQLLQNGDKSQANNSVASPYLEYCKRRAHLLSIKEKTKRNSYIDMNRDVGVFADRSKETNNDRKRFPTLHAKSNKGGSKNKMKSSQVHAESHRVKQTESALEKKNGFCMEPRPLTVIAVESPSTDGKRNPNKKIHKDLKYRGKLSTSNTKDDRLHHISEKRRVTVGLAMVVNEAGRQNTEHKL